MESAGACDFDFFVSLVDLAPAAVSTGFGTIVRVPDASV
jgi:hypothetical protein